MSAGGGVSWRGGEAFYVEIELTEAGRSQFTTINELLFDYIDKVRDHGVEAWRYDELADIATIGFANSERGDPIREVAWMADRLHYVEPQLLLKQPYVYSDFDPKLINRFLGYLNRDNYVAVVVDPDLAHEQVSPIYNTPFKVTPKAEFVVAINEADKPHYLSLRNQLSLPKKNVFIPTDFSVVGTGEQKSPKVIFNKKGVTGWYANDNTFNSPKLNVDVKYLLPEVANSPRNFAIAEIAMRMISDDLSEISYNAAVGNLHYKLSANSRGLSLSLSGYNDTLPKLSELVSDALNRFIVDDQYRKTLIARFFDKNREQLLRNAVNRLKDTPSRQIFRALPAAIYSPYWSAEDIRKAYQNLDRAEFEHNIEGLFAAPKTTAFVFGNIGKRDAKKLIKSYRLASRKSFENKNTKSESYQSDVVKLTERPLGIHVATAQDDHATVIYVQGQSTSYADRAEVAVLKQILAANFFNELRTEQQLGYAVYLVEYPFKEVPALLAVIQSPGYSSEVLYQRMSAFFEAQGKTLFENFERDKAAVISRLKEEANTLSQLASEYWQQISVGQTAFDERSQLIAAVQAVTQDEVFELYEEGMLNKMRNIIFASSKAPSELGKFDSKVIEIDDVQAFKRKTEGYFFP